MPAKGYTKRTTEWTREAMVDAAHRWFEKYGRSPAANDWHPGDCRSAARRSMARASMWLARAARFDEGEYPWRGSVYKEFGGWNDFLDACELPVNHRAPERAPRPEISQDGLVDLTAQVVALPDGVEKKAALLLIGETAFALAERIPDEPN